MGKIYKIIGNPGDFEHLDVFHKLAQQFLPYAHKRLKFDKPVDVQLMSDPQNAKDPLGKTAYYDPNNMKITLFVDRRHVKDIMRSLAHELVHHKQNCRGDFDGDIDTSPGYAQEDSKMRKLEGEAYLEGSGYLFRDWEDTLKKENKEMSNLKEEKSIFAPNHYCVHHGGVYMEGEVKLGKVINHNWNDKLQKVTKYDMKFEDGTILENVKFEDILVTEASLAQEHKHAVMKRDDEELEEGEKPDFPDVDGDGDKEEPISKAQKDKKEKEGGKKGKKDLSKMPPQLRKAMEKKKGKETSDDETVDEAHCPGKRDDEKEETNETWFRGNKDQLLFERLVQKWTK